MSRPLYISKLEINRYDPSACRDIDDRYELHRTIMQAYPRTLPADERILFRVEDYNNNPTVSILVQSHYLPCWEQVERMRNNYHAITPQIQQINPQLYAGQSVRFRLQANPTVKRDKKRHAILGREHLLYWLQNKSNAHGFVFDPLSINVSELGNLYGKRRYVTWYAVQFDGTLIVADVASLNNALRSGIGSAKGFGFGLVSLYLTNN